MEGYREPLLTFDNLLPQLTELRKTAYLLDYQFIIKKKKQTAQEHPGGRDGYGKAGEMGFDALGVLCPPSTSTCSATWKLSEPIYEDFYEGFTVEAQLIKSLAIGDW